MPYQIPARKRLCPPPPTSQHPETNQQGSSGRLRGWVSVSSGDSFLPTGPFVSDISPLQVKSMSPTITAGCSPRWPNLFPLDDPRSPPPPPPSRGEVTTASQRYSRQCLTCFLEPAQPDGIWWVKLGIGFSKLESVLAKSAAPDGQFTLYRLGGENVYAASKCFFPGGGGGTY